MKVEIWLLIGAYLACVYWFGGRTIPQFDPEDEKEARAAMRTHTFAVAIVAVFGVPFIFAPLYAAYLLLIGG